MMPAFLSFSPASAGALGVVALLSAALPRASHGQMPGAVASAAADIGVDIGVDIGGGPSAPAGGGPGGGSLAPSDADSEAVARPATGEDIVQTARMLLGTPYEWGGTTTDGFDCSGFVRYVFAHHGIGLPRTAAEQAGVGDAPYPGDLRPGDLLFFYGGRGAQRGAQHIAIYIGADTIIHASSGGRRVKLDVLTRSVTGRSWFRQRLIAVRRLIQTNDPNLATDW
ncbi:MAG: C40 family peptidase [Gemmatimonadaceae bacterium]